MIIRIAKRVASRVSANQTRRRRCKISGAFLAAVVSLGSLPAQSPAPQPPAPAPQATFKSGTNLVLVPVVMRDRDGQAVGNLKKEDFELLDQGKPQEIVRFSVEKLSERALQAAEQMKALQTGAAQGIEAAHAPGETMATRFVAYLFDDIHLSPGDLSQTRDAALKYLSTGLAPGDRAAVFTTSTRVTVDFTSDPGSVTAGISRIKPISRQTGMNDCPQMTFYEAERIMDNDSGVNALARLEQQRCGGLKNSIGMSQAADIRAAASVALAEGQRNTQEALQQIAFVVQRLIATPGQRQIIMVSPGFYVPQQYRLKQNQLLDQAIHANVVVSSLDARGLFQFGSNQDASKPGYLPPGASGFVDSFRRIDALQLDDVLAELAEGTGGILYKNNNDFAEGLRKSGAVPEYQYTLGFSPRDLKYDGSFHKLKVNLKGKGGDLQARRGYFAPNHAPDAVADLKQRMRDTMFARDELLDIPLEVATEFFKSPDGKANLSVLAKIALKTLPYRLEDGRQVDTLTIDTAVFDGNGQMLDGTSKTFTLKFRQETFTQSIAKGMSEKASFTVPPGNYVVRVVIHESEGDMMSARNGAVQIP